MPANSSAFACSLVAVAGTCLVLSDTARATGLAWNNAAGGSAATATNWSPNQLPSAADDLSFNLAGAYTVTWPFASVPTSRTQTYRAGTVTGTFNGHTVTSQVQVGQLSGNNATLNISGTLNSTSFVTMGRDTGSTGTVNLPAFPGQLVVSGAGNDLIVGHAGHGTFNILNGADAQVTETGDDLLIGNLATGVGVLSLQGGVVNQSSIATNNTTSGGDVVVGVSGSGTVTIGNNGNLTSGNDATLAQNPGSIGSVTLTDSSGSTTAQFRTVRDLHIGHNTTAAAAGTATMSLNAGALVQVGTGGLGTTFLGDPNGGSGTLNIANGLFATDVLVIDPVNGHLNHTGGELRITPGGSFSSPFTPTVVSGPAGASAPVLHFQSSAGTLAGGFRLGNSASASGSLLVDAGAVVSVTPSPSGTEAMVLGGPPSSFGAITVSGPGSTLTLDADAAILIGNGGAASITVANQGLLIAHQSMHWAANAGSHATGSISGGAAIDAGLGFNIGGVTSPGGVASVSVNTSGTVDCSGLTVFPASSLSIDDGVVTVHHFVASLRGTTTLANGGELAGVDVDVQGLVQGSGNLYGNITVQPGGTITANGGDLFIGSTNNSVNGFSNAGTLNVGSATAHIMDGNGSAAGDVTIAGGQLIAPGGLVFGATDSLTGHGNITATVALSPTTQVGAQTAEGLIFNSPVSGHDILIGGTRVLFAAGGPFTGSGLINTIVASEEGADVTATGALTLGNDDVNSALTLEGELHVGPHTVTLRSNSRAHLGTRTTLAGGSLRGPADNPRTFTLPTFPNPTTRTVGDSVPIALDAFDVLEGTGTVASKLVTSADSTVIATGPLSLVGSGTAVILHNTIFDNGEKFAPWEGNLNAGPNTVTFSGLHLLGGTTTLAGGTVDAQGLGLRGLVTGNGTLRDSGNTPTVANGGTISPGGPAAGEIRISGGFLNDINPLLGSPGTLQLDIGGDQGAENDVLRVVDGDAQLSGSLNVGLIDGPPDPAFEYVIIVVEHGVASGEFTTVNLPAGMTIEYRSSEVVIHGAACYADFNQDGGIDGGDIDAFFAAWEGGDFAADVNQDGGVDGGDVTVFFAAWEAGGC